MRFWLFAAPVALLTVAAPWPAAAAGDDPASVVPVTVAVIPFTNISGHASDDGIGSGIAEALMADLQGVVSLSVIGREALHESARRQGSALTGEGEPAAMPRERELGATWLVSGGYQRVGDLLRITGRVVDVQTGTAMAVVNVDGSVDELVAVQDRIVAELREALDLLTAETREARLDLGTRARAPAQGGTERVPDTLSPERVTGTLTLEDAEGASSTGTQGVEPAPASSGSAVASDAGVLTGRPSLRAPHTSSAPSIDGRLDDLVWRTATRITEFVQRRPLDGAPATEQTEVYIAYDRQNIYVGMYVHYSDPALIRANRVDRDQTFQDDTISLYFDTFLDQQRAYVFSVNGYGVQGDALMNAGTAAVVAAPVAARGGRRGRGGRGGGVGGAAARAQGNRTWDALFESAGTLVEDGWTAEMAIPFKSLRYPSKDGDEVHRWGFQIERAIRSKDESDVWAPISRDIAAFMPQMGVLEGLSNLSTSRNIEIMPTFTAIRVDSLDTATGAFERSDADPEAGVNFKYGVTSSLTLDFTYNPDFSQIESDLPQIEVNQRFPLFFPELRPFFLEGQEIFNVPGPIALVHTRTIVDPRYGAKLTGKVGNTTIGLIFADDEAPGRRDDPDDPAFGQTAQFFIGRVRYDLYAESHIGTFVTDREFMDSYSRVGGVDGRFGLGQKAFFAFRAFASDRRDEEGIRQTGPMINTNLRWNGRNLRFFVLASTTDPEFGTDVGFVRRVDTRRLQGHLSYRWWPENWIINWGPRVNYARYYNFQGTTLEDEQAGVGVTMQFAKNIFLNGNVNRDLERFGGIDFFKTIYSLGGGVNTSRRVEVGGSFNWGDQIEFSDNPFLGDGSRGTAFINLRPYSRLRSNINIEMSRLTDPRVNEEVFDVKIFRALTTYQFSERLLLRNIMEYNTFDKTLAANVLFTYRVNAGTVFFVGYDDHYQQGNRIDDTPFSTTALQRTNRAFFTKLRVLFRY